MIENKTKLAMLILSLLFFVIGCFLIIYQKEIPQDKIETKCYDRYSNEIKEEVCLEDNYILDNYKQIQALCFSLFIISIIAYLTISLNEYTFDGANTDFFGRKIK